MNSEIEDVRSAAFGMFTALQASIRALITTHPNHEALIAAIRHESEETISLLLARQVPDQAIEAFRDAWNGVAIYQEGASPQKDTRL